MQYQISPQVRVKEAFLGAGFDWASLLTSAVKGATDIYSSYTNLEIAKSVATDNVTKANIDLQIAKLQAEAANLLAGQAQSSQNTTMQKIMPYAIAGGVGLIALLAMR